MKTTKTFDGKKYHYFFNGKLFRNSTRNFKYACIATSRETGNSFMVSLGNDRLSTLKSMSHCYAHYCNLKVVEIASEASTDESNTVRYYLIDNVTGFKPEGIDLMNEFNYMQSLQNAIKLAKECEARNHHDVEIWRETCHGKNVRVIWK